ncbi:hypothetical protein LDENG_00271540 [Lucifuga dentata]|nr:hypothetical protein LDENG_00271540 [Lucifuga dentata]
MVVWSFKLHIGMVKLSLKKKKKKRRAIFCFSVTDYQSEARFKSLQVDFNCKMNALNPPVFIFYSYV